MANPVTRWSSAPSFQARAVPTKIPEMDKGNVRSRAALIQALRVVKTNWVVRF